MVLIFLFACETKQSNPKIINQSETTKVEQSDEKVFTVVEQMPQYPGGEQALMEFIGKSVIYPDTALKAGIQGKVLISFVINKDGKVVNPKVEKGVNPSLDQEALRVMGMMPEWTPGKQNGENVAVQYTIPINFALK